MSKSNEKGGDLPRGLIGRKGTPTGKSARLPSIRTPRDLTLGGIPKKTFVPNIPVRRDKTQLETSPLVASTSQDNKDRNKKPERGRGRGRGRGAANIVQSHSIFEQGPTQQIKQREERGHTERVSTAGSSRGGVKKEKPESEETKRVIDDLLRDDFIDDAHANTSDDMPPIYLPLSIPKNEIKVEVKREDEVKVKQESMDTTDSVCTPETQRVITPTPSASEMREKMTCDRLFMDPTKSDVGEIVFVQLPDVLPGIPPSAEDDTARKSTDANKSTKSSTDTLKLSKLADFSEGHIGKLRVRASGKTELILGNIVLDMNMGTPCSFLQDVVCVRTGGQEGDNLSVLAHVTNKVVCTPNFELLLS